MGWCTTATTVCSSCLARSPFGQARDSPVANSNAAATTKPTKSRKRRAALPHRHPRRTREEHSQEIAQDYVEIIAELIAATGEARVIDLARRLGVTHVTVARTIQRLQRAGLVTSLPYRSIFLTASGSKL